MAKRPDSETADCDAGLAQGAARDAEAIQVLLGHRGRHSQYQAFDRRHAGWLHPGVLPNFPCFITHSDCDACMPFSWVDLKALWNMACTRQNLHAL